MFSYVQVVVDAGQLDLVGLDGGGGQGGDLLAVLEPLAGGPGSAVDLTLHHHLLGLIGFSVLQLGLKLGQHLGGEGEELGHLTVSVPGDDSPVTIVLNSGLLEGQLKCLSILLDHLDPGILRDGDTILVPGQLGGSGHLGDDHVGLVHASLDVGDGLLELGGAGQDQLGNGDEDFISEFLMCVH